MTPLISVLIPIYQSERFLKRCLNSVLLQSYPNIEIVMVDDGSTDNSVSICKQYLDNYHNVRLISQNHQGVSHARQEAIRISKGKFLFFLDSDDYLDPKAIEYLYSLLLKYNATISQCFMNETNKEIFEKIDYEAGTVEVYKGRQLVEIFCCGYGRPRSMLTAKLYKRELFEQVHFPVGCIHEDTMVMHKLLDKADIMACSDLQLYYYYKNPNSIMNRPFSYERYAAIEAAKSRIDFCRKKELYFAADMSCLRYCFDCIILYRRTYFEISNTDANLEELHEKYKRMASYVLKKGFCTNEVSDLLLLWISNPLCNEVPNYWEIAKNYYEDYYQLH